MCQTPNSADVTTTAQVTLEIEVTSASITPRNANSSTSTVPKGMSSSTLSGGRRPGDLRDAVVGEELVQPGILPAIPMTLPTASTMASDQSRPVSHVLRPRPMSVGVRSWRQAMAARPTVAAIPARRTAALDRRG